MGAWSPDGTRISLTANDRDPAHFDVLTLDLGTGQRTRLLDGTHEATAGAWNKDGRMVAIQDRSTPDQRPVILGGAAPEWLPRLAPARYASLRWDGDALLGLTDAGGRDHVALCRIDPASGAATPVQAPDGARWKPGRCRAPGCSPRSRTTAAGPSSASAPARPSARWRPTRRMAC